MAKTWQAGLLRTTRGSLEPHVANAEMILKNDPRWKGVLAYNELLGSTVFTGEPPGWEALGKRRERLWQDVDTTRLATWLATEYALLLTPEKLDRVVDLVAHAKVFHPVRDEIRALVWDRTPRLDTWLIRLAGAPDNAYVRAVSSRWLISAVARTFEPGCKADHMLILEGKKGRRKSTAARILAGSSDRFLEGLRDMDVEGAKSLRGKIIVELPELDGLAKARVTQMRAFLTVRVDTYRDSFGRRTRDFPRQCVFIGTVNPPYDYAEEEERRFWPVRIKRINTILLAVERKQLWAEAYARYKNKEVWHLQEPALVAMAAQEQLARKREDPWEDRIQGYLEIHKKRSRYGISSDEVIEYLGADRGGGSRVPWIRVRSILAGLGWRRIRSRSIPGRPRLWFPPKPPKKSIV